MGATPTTSPGGTDATTFRYGHLATVMRMRGISDAQLAEQTGLDRTAIYRIRTGVVVPSLESTVVIVKALDLPLTDLVEVPR
jgi:DNA-binding phage protein